MLNVKQFKSLVLDPTLKEAELYSSDASDLILGTLLAESNLEHIKQIGGGPAVGLLQMEPATFDDIFYRYLNRTDKKELKHIVDMFLIPEHPSYTITRPFYQLITNLPFAVLMARIRYLMVPAPIPKTIEGQAAYWKQYYNTEEGAGTIEKYLRNWTTIKEFSGG